MTGCLWETTDPYYDVETDERGYYWETGEPDHHPGMVVTDRDAEECAYYEAMANSLATQDATQDATGHAVYDSEGEDDSASPGCIVLVLVVAVAFVAARALGWM